MCGIFGYISRKDEKIDNERIARAAAMMAHRGPDAQNAFVNHWAALAHNRLSIIDLSHAADQPMYTRDGRYGIIYNGELYNYKELRQELEARGEAFRTKSDTEVLLNAYAAFSAGCLKKLRGMFAFVIVDFYRKEVFAVRDHLGIKPLFMYQSDNCLIFSSEVKPLSEFMRLEPDYDAYFENIAFRYVAGQRTCFKNITKVLPGSYMLYSKSDDKLTEHRYYDLSATFAKKSSLRPKDAPQIIDEAEEVLVDSVKVHTYSDVGYNLQLSGGLDSSLIAAILVKRLGISDITTYSITIPGYEYDESAYQGLAVERLGLAGNHNSIEMTNEIFSDLLDEAVYVMESPLVHVNCACLLYLTRYSAGNSKVILTGEGADEVFGGYKHYGDFMHDFNMFDRNRYSHARKKFLYGLSESYFAKRHMSQWPLKELKRIMAPQYSAGADFPYRKSLLRDMRGRDLISKLLYFDQRTYLSTLLDRQDKMSMANSVEARVPYCDVRVYEHINAIPPEVKLKGGERKYLLKQIAKKYLPQEIIFRPKNGFNLPFIEWLKDERYLGRFIEMLLDDTTRKRGIFNMDYVHGLVRTLRGGINDGSGKDVGKKLVNLIMFELWHRIFFDGSLDYASRRRLQLDRQWVWR